jgi:CubicO group peptidase (beta-lactamase class C family)
MTPGTSSSPESVGVSSRGLEQLDAHVQGYIDSGKLPGGLTLVARKGEIVHLSTLGLADVERGTPVRENTIYRIYSMTKPLTSIALMQLYEQGKLQIDDPVHKYIPAWEKLAVYVSGEYPDFVTRPADRPMTIRDLLSHQSGLTYGAFDTSPVDSAYAAVSPLAPSGTLQDMVDKLADLPLKFSPGTRWNYSVSTDVCGYLVQVISGQPLDEYLSEHIIGPLGMVDTAFSVAPASASRLAANYGPTPGAGLRLVDDPQGSRFTATPTFLSGGGGLTSTAHDYWRFAQALCNGGELEGTRIIGRKTLELMTSNHLPLGGDLASVAFGQWSETAYAGVGFGLGFSVMLDPATSQGSGTPGEFAWGGAASTAFFVDPVEELVFIFMTQLMPSSTYNIRREFRALIYGALT